MMLLIIIGIVSLLVALLYRYMVNTYNYWSSRGVLQGKTVWLFGDNWKNLLGRESMAEMVQNAYTKFPEARYCGMYSFVVPLLVIKDPKLLKHVTVKDFDHFTDHINFMPPDSDPLWSKNLLALTGKKWREMRNILSPSFTSSKIKTMFLLMTECSENCVQYLLKRDEDVISVEIKDLFTRFTNDMIASIAFGAKVDSLAEPNNEFYLKAKEATNIGTVWKTITIVCYSLFPILNKVSKLRLFSEEVRDFFTKVVEDNIRAREEQGIVRPDMIHLLLQARKGIQKQEESDVIDTGFATAQESVVVKEKVITELTDEDITAQAVIFIFAGFDTVASLICFAAYELAVNQDIQNRLRTEVQETYEKCNGKLTYEGLLRMKYLDMVVSETLRKWPTNIALDRVCTKPYTMPLATPDGKPVKLEKGMALWLPTFAIHRDPKYYLDPEKFDPERFSDENKENIKPYTYLPFGLGPRNCIGSRFALIEAKTVLFHILLHFEFVPTEKSVIPLKISKRIFQLNAEGGLWLGLKRINK